MNDEFWIIVFSTVPYLFFVIVLAIMNIYIMDKSKKKKKKYYLIEYRMYCRHEIIIKAKSPLEARIKFQNEYPMCDLISLKEIKNE